MSSTFIGLSILVVYRVTLGYTELVIPLFGIIITIVCVTYLTKKGFLSLSTTLFLWIILFFLNYLMVRGDGIHDTAMFAVPGIMIAASLIFKRWYFLLYVMVALLTIGIIGYLEMNGILINQYSKRTNLFDIIDVVIVLGITTITVRLLADNQARSFLRAKESEQLFRSIIDGIPDALFIIGADGHFIEANNAASKQLGYTKEELMKLSVLDIVPPDNIANTRERMKDMNNVSGLFESYHVRKDGTIIPVEISLVRMMADGNPVVAGLARDITDRKNLELQFFRAQRLESIGTIAGGIAHDLNNILAPILLSIQVLNRKIIDPSSKNILQLIEETTKRGSDLIKQVLSFARGIEGERTTVQLRYLMEEIGKIIQETFPRSIRMRITAAKDLPTIHGDATQLHQVLMNLCVNARDAMPNGGVMEMSGKVEIIDEQFIRTNIDGQIGPYVVISVKDNGVGIPKNIIEKIFDPFFTTKAPGTGTGFGLSTVHTIIKNHNGFVKVISEVGMGTTFKIYLPMIMGEIVNIPKTDIEEVVGNGELILVVDDEASIREITKETLELYGYSVITASDGYEALTLYQTNSTSIALIITDMMMPNVSGSDLIDEVHTIDPNAKILAVSGIQHEIEQFKYQNIQFLHKPFTSKQLLKAIEEMLAKQ